MDVRFGCFTAAARLPDRAAGDGRPAPAELVRLAEAVQAPASEIAGELKAATAVVCVRSSGAPQLTWPAHVGLETELTTALREQGVEAFPASADERLETLSNLTTPSAASDAKRAAAIETRYLVGGTLQTSGPGAASGDLAPRPPLDCVDERLSSTTRIAGSASERSELNHRVVAYCQRISIVRWAPVSVWTWPPRRCNGGYQTAGNLYLGAANWRLRNRSSRATFCKFVDWSGDPRRLSVDLPYAVPNQQWLFLAAWNSHFAISEFTLEDNSDRKP